VNQTVLITDTDGIISAAGASKKEYQNQPIGAELYKAFSARKNLVFNRKNGDNTVAVKKTDESGVYSQIIVPILAGGDIFGAVIMLSFDKNTVYGQNELNLCVTAAAFMVSQLG
jgi:AbrB family transcriptional regulator (stage V sporulation protein T)